jgi:enediyne polyketide synthase
VDALARDGVAPISVDRGVALFLGVLGGTAGGALILCGRIPELPTLRITRPALPLGRFLEHPRVYFPGVELISDAVLSGPADPYLDDHKIGGDRVLPAVLGLEAIAQAAAAVAGEQRVVAFESVHIERPIIVPAHGEETLRIACLVRAPGVVDAVLRCQRSSFVVDHFHARCRLAPGDTAAARDAPGCAHQSPGGDVALDPARDLYGALLFHSGRFRRLARYRHLHARACEAEICPDTGQAWFGRYLPDALWLGDPGARDAALHALQACVPHARLLPVAVAQIAFDDVRATGARVVRAVELWQRGDTYCYDLDLYDPAGRRLESWRGLELHALEAVYPDAWPPALLAAHAERRVAALLPAARLRVALLTDGTQTIAAPPPQRAAGCIAAAPARPNTDLSRARKTASAQALGMLLEDAARLHRRADGRWEVPGCSDALSTAHADRLTLAVAGAAPLTCDLETVRARPAQRWEHLLGPRGRALATRVAAETGEPLAQAATRVWTARECLKKSGSAPDTPLTLASVDTDGWVVFAVGTLAIASVAATLTDQPSPRVLAVLAGRSDAQL